MTRRFSGLAATLSAAEPAYLLLALVCLVAWPEQLWIAGLALMAATWLVRWLATGRLSVRTLADWPCLVLVLMLAVSLSLGVLPKVTWQAAAYLVAGLLTFNSLVNWISSEGRLRWAGWGALAVGVGLALVALVAVQWQSETKLPFIPAALYQALPVRMPDPIHPNVMAGALALILPLPMAWLLLGGDHGLPGWVRRWLMRTGWAVAWLLMAAVLLLTKSRGGYLATLVGVFILLGLWRRWTVLGALVCVEGVALAWTQLGGARLADLLLTTQTIGGWQGRQEVWSRALDMIRDFPVTGIGIGSYGQTAVALYPLILNGPATVVPHAHNLFLQVGVDLGLPGLAAYLALWLTCTVMAWRAYLVFRRAGRQAVAATAAGLGTSLIVLGLHGLVDAVTWGTKPAALAWAMMAMALAAFRLARRPDPLQRPPLVVG